MFKSADENQYKIYIDISKMDISILKLDLRFYASMFTRSLAQVWFLAYHKRLLKAASTTHTQQLDQTYFLVVKKIAAKSTPPYITPVLLCFPDKLLLLPFFISCKYSSFAFHSLNISSPFRHHALLSMNAVSYGMPRKAANMSQPP